MTFISETSPDQTRGSASLLMAACISIRCMFHGLSITPPPARHMSPTPQAHCFNFGCAGWLFIAEHRLSLVAASEELLSSCGVQASRLRWRLLRRSLGSRCAGFSGCRIQAPWLQCLGLWPKAWNLPGFQGSNPCSLHQVDC